MFFLHLSLANGSSADESANEDDDRTKEEILDNFLCEWRRGLDKEDEKSLAIFLCNIYICEEF